MTLTSHEYWTQIATLASDITAESRKEEREIYDVLHEALDQHEFVIYTAKALQVLVHSPSDSAWLDEHGSLPEVDNMSDLYAKLAFMAMYVDVMQHSNFNAEEVSE